MSGIALLREKLQEIHRLASAGFFQFDYIERIANRADEALLELANLEADQPAAPTPAEEIR